MYQLFSERNKNPKDKPDVYEYDNIPDSFRNQLFYILTDVIDEHGFKIGTDLWDSLHDHFSREIGVKSLGEYQHYDGRGKEDIEYYISTCKTISLLDFIDYTWNIFNGMSDIAQKKCDNTMLKDLKNSVTELNYRLKQNNLGYEYVNNELIRIDNKILHKDVIKPALYLLNSEECSGAEEEFHKAFEYRRKNDNKNAILEALKAFESTMKTICDKKGYTYDSNNDTAKKLINILESNNFYPKYMNTHIASLRTTLESGLPVLRNKNAGHGQGATVTNVSDEFTEYALNLAATNMVLLVKIYQAQK